MLSTFKQALMGVDADSQCNADYAQRSPERTNSRNGYQPRQLDTRAGTIELAVPKLRSGIYFPDWLLEPRKRAEKALTSVVATCNLLCVSTRRMDKLVQSLGISGLSRSQVSVMAKDLDTQVAAFRHRRLDQGPYTFVAADAHAGLVAAIGTTLPGASWQRCRTHYAVNLMAQTPKSSWPWVRTMLHSVYDQPDAKAVDAKYDGSWRRSVRSSPRSPRTWRKPGRT